MRAVSPNFRFGFRQQWLCLKTHVTPSPGIEPGPHWWEANALTTAPFLLPFVATVSSIALMFKENALELGSIGLHTLFYLFISGGWLLVLNVVINSSNTSPQLSTVTSYRGISGYHSNKMVVTSNAIYELQLSLQFTQLRFYCNKQQVGRTFHVITAANSSGNAVVQYFSGMTDVLPDSCGSFVRMKNDNSMLAQLCDQWGRENDVVEVGKWGTDDFGANGKERLYNNTAFVVGAHHWIVGAFESRFQCDDYKSHGLSTGDFWKVFVR